MTEFMPVMPNMSIHGSIPGRLRAHCFSSSNSLEMLFKTCQQLHTQEILQQQRSPTKETPAHTVSEPLVNHSDNSSPFDRMSEMEAFRILKGKIQKDTTHCHLWMFLFDLMMDPAKTNVASWEDNKGMFRIKDPAKLALLWGEKRNRTNMTYEKLSRSLRHYYEKKILKKVPKRKYTYKFNSKEILKSYDIQPFFKRPSSGALRSQYNANKQWPMLPTTLENEHNIKSQYQTIPQVWIQPHQQDCVSYQRRWQPPTPPSSTPSPMSDYSPSPFDLGEQLNGTVEAHSSWSSPTYDCMQELCQGSQRVKTSTACSPPPECIFQASADNVGYTNSESSDKQSLIELLDSIFTPNDMQQAQHFYSSNDNQATTGSVLGTSALPVTQNTVRFPSLASTANMNNYRSRQANNNDNNARDFFTDIIDGLDTGSF